MQPINPHPRIPLLVSALVLSVAPSPMLATDTDQRIESAATSSYNFRTYLKDDAIKVKSSHGVVTLTGTVAEPFHKSLAEETVSGLPGVKGVSNELVVTGEQPSEHSDPWITMKVKGALAFHKNVSATDTQVQTQNGIVILTGKAYSAAKKELTGEYA